MKVTEHISNSDRTLFSFEILPPLKGSSISEIFKAIDPLLPYDPRFINVTYHREEYIYRKMANGLLQKVSIRKRPGTVGICAAIHTKYQIDTVPHLICGGFTKEETENALIDLNFLGIDNVLVLRGDPVKNQGAFVPEKDGHPYAIDLLKQCVEMNQARYLYNEYSGNGEGSNFCIGVAGYPEKHYEAPNMEFDLKHLKAKIEAGADYVVTQLFYDNSAFKKFKEKCNSIGIDVPIIAGIKPITSSKQLQKLPRFFHINIPNELAQAIEDAPTPEQEKQVGIKWCIEQCKELIEMGVPAIHFYTMGRSESVAAVAKEIYQ